MTYRSKSDTWVFMLISLVGAAEFVIGGVLIIAALNSRQPFLALPGCLMISVGMLIVWLFLTCDYEITGSDLIIRFGPLRFSLPIDSIVEVHSTNRVKVEFAWGLAWSIDRLLIKCRGRLMPYAISPDDKAAFLDELLRARPDLKVIEE